MAEDERGNLDDDERHNDEESRPEGYFGRDGPD